MNRELARQVLEAVLFASAEPLDERTLAAHLGGAQPVGELLLELQRTYADRGVRLERSGERWAFRTAPEIAPYLTRKDPLPRRVGRAALETLAVIAYRQPVTRAEIEAIRGVSLARGVLDQLIEAGWVAPRGRRDVPGRPLTWGTTQAFLDQFGLESLDALPRAEEISGGELFGRPIPAPAVPLAALREDEADAGT